MSSHIVDKESLLITVDLWKISLQRACKKTGLMQTARIRQKLASSKVECLRDKRGKEFQKVIFIKLPVISFEPLFWCGRKWNAAYRFVITKIK